MTEKKFAVVMTEAGRAKEFPAGTDIREVLEAVFSEHQRAGSQWDRPSKLFVGGECVVAGGLTDIAWEYGEYHQSKEDELDAALDEWVGQRFGRKPKVTP